MGFPITTGMIIVIIDLWLGFIIFSIFCIFILYFSKPVKPPYLVEREQAISVASFLYLGFWKWKSIFKSDQISD